MAGRMIPSSPGTTCEYMPAHHFLISSRRPALHPRRSPGAFLHYRIFSENHVIDIASQESPEVRILEGDDESVPYSIN
jgi:hypothetical protein